jgi:hypothetical protein
LKPPLGPKHQAIAARLQAQACERILELSEIEFPTEEEIINANLFDLPHRSSLPVEQAEGLLDTLGEFDYGENVCGRAERALIARRQAARQTGASI